VSGGLAFAELLISFLTSDSNIENESQQITYKQYLIIIIPQRTIMPRENFKKSGRWILRGETGTCGGIATEGPPISPVSCRRPKASRAQLNRRASGGGSNGSRAF
jgi:hypothetical protein